MKKYTDRLTDKMIRLAGVVLGQLIWMVPVGALGWYAYTRMGDWCDSYFNVAAAQQFAQKLSARTAELSEPVIWNPGTMMLYVKAVFLNMAAGSKAYTLSALSGMTAGLGRLGLDILGILLGIYAFLRIRKAYRMRRQETRIVQAICREILPEIEALRHEMIQQIDKLIRGKQEAVSLNQETDSTPFERKKEIAKKREA